MNRMRHQSIATATLAAARIASAAPPSLPVMPRSTDMLPGGQRRDVRPETLRDVLMTRGQP